MPLLLQDGFFTLWPYGQLPLGIHHCLKVDSWWKPKPPKAAHSSSFSAFLFFLLFLYLSSLFSSQVSTLLATPPHVVIFGRIPEPLGKR